MSLFLSGLLLSFWIVLMLFLIYKLGGQIVGFLFSVLMAIPLLRHLTNPILALVLLPWVGFHELCHAVVLAFAGAKVTGIRLYPEIKEGQLELGQTMASGGSPFFMGFAFAAPLLVGTLAVALMMVYVFRVPWLLLLSRHERIVQTFYDTARLIRRNGNPITIFLFFSVGNGSMPGVTDWRSVARFLGAIFVTLFIATGVLLTVGSNVLLDPGSFDWWLSGLSMLAIQFTLIVVMDLVVWLVLLIPGMLASSLWKRG